MRNKETLSGSDSPEDLWGGAGKPTVKGAEFPGWKGCPRSECRRPKVTGKRDQFTAPPLEVFRITGRIPGLVPGPERVLTCGRWTCERQGDAMPALKDKLDTNGERTGRPLLDLDADRWESMGSLDLIPWGDGRRRRMKGDFKHFRNGRLVPELRWFTVAGSGTRDDEHKQFARSRLTIWQ